jgi:hypothetical protein
VRTGIPTSLSIICEGDDVFAGDNVFGTGGTIYRLAPGKPAVPVVKGRNGTTLLLVDAAHLYWLEGGGVIRRTPRASPGDVETVVAGDVGPDNEGNIEADATHFYFTRSTSTSKAMLRVAHAGGTPESLGSLPFGGPGKLAVGATSLLTPSSSRPGSLWQLPKSGGTATMLVDAVDAPEDAAMVGDRPFFRATLPSGRGSAVFEVKDGAPVQVTGPADEPATVVVDASGVTWAKFVGPEIYRTPLDGGARTLTTALPRMLVSSLRFDPETLCIGATFPENFSGDQPAKVFRLARP